MPGPGLLAAGASIALAAVPAQAEQTADGTIVVTAQKREQVLDEVPMSAAVIDGTTARERRVSTIENLPDQVPGLTRALSFRGVPVFTLRGVGFNSPNLSATSPVGLYQDEIALAFPALAAGPVFDIARVEVLKGPQGTLYGRSTTGGAINIVTRKPAAEREGYLSLRGGSFQSYGAEGAIGGGLCDGLSARLAFSGDRSDKGWQHSVTRHDRLGKVDRMGARLSLIAEPADRFSLLLTGNWWRDRSDTQAAQSAQFFPQGIAAAGIPPAGWRDFGLAIGLPPAFFTQSFRPDSAGQADWPDRQIAWGGSTTTPPPLRFRKDNRFHSLSLRGDIALGGGVTLTGLSSYAHYKRAETSAGSGFNIENAILQGRGRISSLAQEVRLSGKSEAVDWIAGVSFSRDKVDELDRSWLATTSFLQVVRATAAQWAGLGGASPAQQAEIFYGGRDAESRSRHLIRSAAAFGQADIAFASDLTMTLGARYTQDRTRFSGCSGDQGDGNLAVLLNAFYGGLGIPAAMQPGDCATFLGPLADAVLSGGAIPFPQQGLFRARLKENSVSGRLALSWQASDALMLYGAVSHGSKAGVFPNIEANVASQYRPATREKLTSFELGAKGRPTDWLGYEWSAFYYDYRNKQVYGAVPDILFGALARIVNVPRSHAWGMDATVRAEPGAGFELDIAASLLRTRIDRYSGFDDTGAPRNFKGGAFPYSPRFQLVAHARKTVPLGAGWQADAGATLRHSARSRADLAGDRPYRIKAYTEADLELAVTHAARQLRLALLVQNVTDTYRWNNVLLQSDSFTRYAAMPRRWTVSVTQGF